MSTWNSSKANYHPVSQLAGNLPNGSYLLPGNEYYSVEGMAPRLQFEHNSKIKPNNFSQSHRIDPIHSLMDLKRQGTTLTKYYKHQPEVEVCRDRYIFVPTYLPREEPNEYVKHPGLEQFKRTVENSCDYRLKDISKLPDIDYHVLPKEDLNDDAYRIYKPKQPYDMMVLRDTYKFNPRESDERTLGSNPNNFISSTTIGSKP